LALSTQSVASPLFLSLGDLEPAAVSADGSVVVGAIRGGGATRAVRWTEAGGAEILVQAGDARGVSDDGSVVVGTMESGSGGFRWSRAEGVVDLGGIAGAAFPYSAPNDVSADGSVIVGQAFSGAAFEAFRWTATGGMVALGDLVSSDQRSSTAYAVSADGSVVAGSSFSTGDAFRWTRETGMIALGWGSPPLRQGEAFDVSADGSVIVGGYPAFRWTEVEGAVPIPDMVSCECTGWASGVSSDGSIVVGELAWIWDAANGTREITYPGWRLDRVNGISSDGRILFGVGTDPSGNIEQGWIASLDALHFIPEPGTCILLGTGLGALASRRRRARPGPCVA
jgi:uncharacterized membrane protein